MTTTVADPTSHKDEQDLAAFGYTQQLHRRLGSYASFAAGFSFVSILTTVFELFGLGFSFGGAAFFWTWPIVFGGQLLVALCFAELASRYPISGCIYQWSRRLSNPTVGWFAGWTMLIAQIVTISAAAIALQVVMPTIWSGFELVGGNPSLTTSTGATNACLLGAILIGLTTTINAIGINLMSRINSIGVTCELIGVTALIALLFVHAKRGPSAVLHQTGAPHGGYFGLFIVSALMAAYVMVGFDSAGELSEETKDPRRTAPRAIIKALCASGLGGGLLLLAAILAAPSLSNGELATGGLPYVLTSRLGTTVGKIFLCDVVVAISVCTLAIQTASTRMMFSMSRDRVLPFSRVLSHVNRVTGTPIAPAIVTGVLSLALLFVNLGKPAAFTDLTSACIVTLYAAYLFVTIPQLIRRLRGGIGGEADEQTFSLGRWGLAVNLGAVIYGGAMTINMAWPRASVYDVGGGSWYLQWFSVLLLAGTAVFGAVAYANLKRQDRIQPVLREAAPAIEAVRA
ncbi:MAG TPA: amino acid permease [Solirubrobacteraceae bacterium]